MGEREGEIDRGRNREKETETEKRERREGRRGVGQLPGDGYSANDDSDQSWSRLKRGILSKTLLPVTFPGASAGKQIGT